MRGCCRNASLTFPPKNAPPAGALKPAAWCVHATDSLGEGRPGTMHPVLRSATAAAKARFTAGARVAFAMLCLFAHELRATLARVIAYSAALAVFGLGIAEFAARGAV